MASKSVRQQVPSIAVSVVVHAVILLALRWIILETNAAQEAFTIDTVVADEDRHLEEFNQELDLQEEIATTMNITGGSVSNAVGGSNAPLARQVKLEQQEIVRDPEVQVNVGAETLPGLDVLGDDLGEAEVTGEVGAIVEGYGAALGRLTQELIRLMRSEKLLVAWIFDESESMRDDQQDLKKRLYRVYEELKIVERDPNAAGGSTRKLDEVLLSSINSFGRVVRAQTQKPTADLGELMKAIDQIPVDPTGDENTCAAISAVIRQYQGQARHEKRKLVVIVVSDESGDDGHLVEQVIQDAKTAKAPIYILGREAVFGSLYAHVRWKQPETGYIFYLPIRRGPETPFAEQLQFDGYRRRLDSQMSGFGPYEQVRIARDTGGIFFQLPHEEQDLNDFDNRKNEMLNLREYLPSLDSRREYAEARDRSDFRKAIWDVIVLLNPYQPNSDWLNLPDPETTRETFTVLPAQFMPRIKERLDQMLRIDAALASAQKHLERVRPLREREPSLRWRANYDLIQAQLYWYRLRLFEYALGLDQFVKAGLAESLVKNPMHNRWYVREAPSDWVYPDEAQQKLFKISPDDLKVMHKTAQEQFAHVQELHPGSPWFRRAEFELGRKFGVTFGTYYQPPPKPGPSPPRPKPTPPPKL
ncbi:MAG: VWA domain-containing protein [Planctomycetes bacterium]|nr:VWA domain-containing protein [Planctomycetota bacterium]